MNSILSILLGILLYLLIGAITLAAVVYIDEDDQDDETHEFYVITVALWPIISLIAVPTFIAHVVSNWVKKIKGKKK